MSTYCIPRPEGPPCIVHTSNVKSKFALNIRTKTTEDSANLYRLGLYRCLGEKIEFEYVIRVAIFLLTYTATITGVPVQPVFREAHGVPHPTRRIRLRSVPAQQGPRGAGQHVCLQGQGAAAGVGGQEGQERKGEIGWIYSAYRWII